MEMNMQSKYLTFNLLEKKEKTNVYEVISVMHENRLGVIKWFGRWRQYSFFPELDTIWNKGCLQDIILFIDELMEDRKK